MIHLKRGLVQQLRTILIKGTKGKVFRRDERSALNSVDHGEREEKKSLHNTNGDGYPCVFSNGCTMGCVSGRCVCVRVGTVVGTIEVMLKTTNNVL